MQQTARIASLCKQIPIWGVLLLTACATTTEPSAPPSQKPAVQPQPAPSPVSAAEESALRTLVTQQDRLYRVAAPLLVSNTELCPNHARNLLGFTAKNKYSYSSEFANAAQVVFGMGDRLKVMGVLVGSGAARAGIQQGDELLTIEGQALPQGQNAERQASAILAPLTNGRSSINLTVSRKGSDKPILVPLTYACAFGIELGNSDNVNAYNDGHRVLITRGMLGVASTDDELAYVMAREMAHNALGHASQQRISAAMGGIIDNLVLARPDMSVMVGMGGAKPMSQNLDAAADKLALYMLARAGYNIDNFPSFWQKLTAKYPASVPTAYTVLHPVTPRRISAMNATIRDIKAKRASGKPLMP